MTDEEDTSPLRARPDVPPEMLRALRALKREGPSRSSLEQVAARLAPVLDAPPPVAPSAVGWLLRGLGARAVAFRVAIAALALGATAVWLRPSVREQQLDPARTPAGVESKGDQPAAPPSAPQGAGHTAAVALPAAGEPGSARRIDGLPGHQASGGRSHRTRSKGARGGASGSSSSAALSSGQTGSLRAQAADLDPASARSAEPQAEPAAQKPDAAVPPAVEPPPEPPPARQPSEVELLLEARRLAARDPKAAQRLLEQHAARFPDGGLSPEREVLAIEVLRALGQTAAAEQRQRAFRVRYPNSMHLRRVSSPPASP